jgi:hypothetical protein
LFAGGAFPKDFAARREIFESILFMAPPAVPLAMLGCPGQVVRSLAALAFAMEAERIFRFVEVYYVVAHANGPSKSKSSRNFISTHNRYREPAARMVRTAVTSHQVMLHPWPGLPESSNVCGLRRILAAI